MDCRLEQCADPGVLAQLIKFIVSPVCAPGLHLVLNSGAAKCERQCNLIAAMACPSVDVTHELLKQVKFYFNCLSIAARANASSICSLVS